MKVQHSPKERAQMKMEIMNSILTAPVPFQITDADDLNAIAQEFNYDATTAKGRCDLMAHVTNMIVDSLYDNVVQK